MFTRNRRPAKRVSTIVTQLGEGLFTNGTGVSNYLMPLNPAYPLQPHYPNLTEHTVLKFFPFLLRLSFFLTSPPALRPHPPRQPKPRPRAAPASHSPCSPLQNSNTYFKHTMSSPSTSPHTKKSSPFASPNVPSKHPRPSKGLDRIPRCWTRPLIDHYDFPK